MQELHESTEGASHGIKIREFVFLANINNFQEAADALYISQSTLSRHIQSLENELQNKLFDRTTRSVQLSEFGKFFLPYAQELVCVGQDFYNYFFQINKQPYEIIRLAAIPAMAPYHFTEVVARFQNDNPNYRLEITEIDDLDKVYDDLACHATDFALIHEMEPVDKRFQKLSIAHDRLVAAVPAQHPLAGQDTVSLPQLKSERFLTMPMQSVVFLHFLASCRKNGFHPKVNYFGHKEDVILSLVEHHFGIGILSKIPAEYTNQGSVRLINIEPEIPTSLALVYSGNQKKTTGKKIFLKYCREISDQYFHS